MSAWLVPCSANCCYPRQVPRGWKSIAEETIHGLVVLRNTILGWEQGLLWHTLKRLRTQQAQQLLPAA
jgi:hypothetical protein